MNATELRERYDKGERDFRGAYLGGANLGNADLGGANLRNANLRNADLKGANFWGADLGGANFWAANLRNADLRGANFRGAYLGGADLMGATLSWSSHDLLSEILWRAADTEPRKMLAAFVGHQRDWCWDQWQTWQHPERDWALDELAKWVKDGDDAPEVVRERIS